MQVSKIARPWKRKTARRRAALALMVGACSLGALGTATASAAVFTTPLYGMTCHTYTSGSNGTASCTGSGKWLVAVSCNWGQTYRSGYRVNIEWYDTSIASAGSCWWGVNSVWVEEKLA
jgi:hypothetical protein